MIETNDTTQQVISQILTECLDNEARGSIERKRPQVVRYVYMTASYGKTINSANIYEMGGDSFMRKDQNPYLSDVVFLNRETFMQAGSMVATGP